MPDPLAYLLTWTTYGSWLHGDDRGSVARARAIPGSPIEPVSRGRVTFERSELKHPPMVLDASARSVVHEALLDHARARSWAVLALNVRSNHAHAVVSCPCPPEKAVREFKAWATRRLREHGCFPPEARVWTRHGSTRYLNSPDSVDGAIRYVRDGQ